MPRTATILIVLLLAIARQAVAAPRVVVLEVDGAVQPASLRYLERGLAVAAEMDAELVVVELDTPGGTLVSLREMTTAITQSGPPVAVYVAPPGARAASAGFFLLMAADVAAMAPGTNTGAAHPVSVGGEPADGREGGGATTAVTKATEDAAALIRSLTAARGRSVEWAEKAVRASLAFSAEEAVDKDLVELVASDRRELLRALDGRTIERFDGRSERLRLGEVEIVSIGPTLAERVLLVIGDPQVAYLLLMLGVLGVLAELLSPGTIVPGVVGGISILLALYAFSVLPVSWVAFLLVAIGLGLLVAEVFVTSYGLLAAGGVVSFVLGSLMLIDTPAPDLRIGPELVIPAAVVLGAATLFLGARVWRSRRVENKSGVEAMIGEHGEVIVGIEGARREGTVFVHGEYWTATAELPLAAGARVRVERVEGRRVRVAPVDLVPT